MIGEKTMPVEFGECQPWSLKNPLTLNDCSSKSLWFQACSKNWIKHVGLQQHANKIRH